jgi:hypothetical protein
VIVPLLVRHETGPQLLRALVRREALPPLLLLLVRHEAELVFLRALIILPASCPARNSAAPLRALVRHETVPQLKS